MASALSLSYTRTLELTRRVTLYITLERVRDNERENKKRIWRATVSRREGRIMQGKDEQWKKNKWRRWDVGGNYYAVDGGSERRSEAK